MHLALIVLKQFAEDLGGGNELRRRELLAADHQHVVIDKSAVQRRTRFVVNRSVQVDPAHFGAGIRGQ